MYTALIGTWFFMWNVISLKDNYTLQSITPMTSNLCSDCQHGGLADTKMSLLVPVCAQAVVKHQQGSGTCCSSKPSDAKECLQVSTWIGWERCCQSISNGESPLGHRQGDISGSCTGRWACAFPAQGVANAELEGGFAAAELWKKGLSNTGMEDKTCLASPACTQGSPASSALNVIVYL